MKHYGKLTAAAAAGFMALSAMGVAPVFAAGENYPTDGNISISVPITINKGDATDPATSFEVTAVPAEVADGTTLINGGVQLPVHAGEDGGLSVTAATKDNNYTASVEVDKNAFSSSTAGVYRYNLSAADTTKITGNTEGITWDAQNVTYIVDVYVNNEHTPIAVIVNNANGSSKVDPEFEAQYDNAPVTLKKTVVGNMVADASREYNFSIKVDGYNGETYTFVVTKDGVAGPEQTLTSGTAQMIQLGNNDTVVIKGLSANDTYTFTETDTAIKTDGYSLTISGADETSRTQDEAQVSADTATGKTAKTANDSVQFENKLDQTTPTGILMSAAPYVGLVGLGGIFAGLFFRRKRED